MELSKGKQESKDILIAKGYTCEETELHPELLCEAGKECRGDNSNTGGLECMHCHKELCKDCMFNYVQCKECKEAENIFLNNYRRK